MSRIEYVGVDGCPYGWFGIGIDRDGEGESQEFKDFDELLAHYSDATLILVDIPIGLPEGGGGRCCDYLARRLPGFKRGSSIFPTPTRQAVYKASELKQRGATSWNQQYKAVLAEEREITSKGISRQAFAIAPKIAEVDTALLARGKDATPVVREIHPEVCFWALSGKVSMKCSKKKEKGREERLAILEGVYPKAREVYTKAREHYRTERVGSDDIIDAMVAAVTGYLAQEELRTIPEDPPKDKWGLPIEIVYWPWSSPTESRSEMAASNRARVLCR